MPRWFPGSKLLPDWKKLLKALPIAVSDDLVLWLTENKIRQTIIKIYQERFVTTN